MMRLTREVRFQVIPAGGVESSSVNSWAGRPGSEHVFPFVVVRATVEGAPDPKTGFVCNIGRIDHLIRKKGIPAVGRLFFENRSDGLVRGDALLRILWESIRESALPGTRWAGLECRITPFLSFSIDPEEESMVSTTQCFEFSASHRLHSPELGEEKNREVFGKCANPNGHGHNYQLEVTVRCGEGGVRLPAMERAVMTEVIDRFDHKHLNADCAEFATLNPTVENITRVIWDRLEGKFGSSKLVRVRVWETPKTYAEYTGPVSKQGT